MRQFCRCRARTAVPCCFADRSHGAVVEERSEEMFRTVKIAVVVLVAAAIAVPTALAKQRPVDPLAISALKGRGWSASQIYDWTQGACSYQVKPASCYL